MGGFFVFTSLPILLDIYGFSKFADVMLWPVVFICLLLIIRLGILLYRIKCPECGMYTKTKSYRPESPERLSSYCESCDILWDLGIGNSGD